MNERIQELAEQAILQANEVFDQKGKDYPGIVMEKFAELIVAECMTMCDDLKTQYFKSRRFTTDFGEKNRYAEGEAACDIIKYKMKKQFGVTE
jgi:hypothetical protein